MRKDPFIIGQYYHIYNRGTDKRVIFMDKFDLWRFLQSMEEFNTIEPIGSLFMHNRKKNSRHSVSTIIEDNRLVEIVVYSLNPNHFHFILSPLVENGIEKFMHKLSMGHAKYFNEKYKRSGVLFQGGYKSILIKSDDYLMYLSAYINLNNKIHFLSHPDSNINKEKLFYKSSWEEFLGETKENICNKSIILDRYENVADYKEFAESVAEGIIERRIDESVNLDEDLLIEKLK
ncbi:MAG: transposase [Patescibacteria group bacterium]